MPPHPLELARFRVERWDSGRPDVTLSSMNRNENVRLVRSILGIAAISIGLLAAVVAGVGYYQLRVVGSPDFRGDFESYRVVMFAWNLFQDDTQPASPAKIAGKVSNLFFSCGLAGVGLVVTGGIAIFLPGRKR